MQNSNSLPNPNFLPMNTARLLLRQYRPLDGPLLFAVAQKNRPHLQTYEAKNSLLGPHNEADMEDLVREICTESQRCHYFLIGGFDIDTLEFIVQVYVGVLNRSLPEIEIGYFVDVDHEGKGYVTEAVRAVLQWVFEDLQAHRVSLRCSDTNLRSVRVAEHCGFTYEGHLRETQRDPDGGFSGDLLFGLLHNEVR